MSLAVMSVIVSDYSEGKEKSMDKGLIEVLKAKIDLPCPHIRRWVCLCAGKLWTNSENAKAAALSEKVSSVRHIGGSFFGVSLTVIAPVIFSWF